MPYRKPKHTGRRYPFRSWIKRLSFAMILFVVISIPGARSQDLVLDNMTITGNTTFTASNSITAGPEFTVSSSGAVTLKSGGNITLRPTFYVIDGGVLYALAGVDTKVITEETGRPDDFLLEQNYPNPFNPYTTIQYGLPQPGFIKITIYDIQGKEIRTLLDEHKEAGYHSVTWDSKDKTGLTVPAGVYLYQLKIGERTFTKKLTLIK